MTRIVGGLASRFASLVKISLPASNLRDASLKFQGRNELVHRRPGGHGDRTETGCQTKLNGDRVSDHGDRVSDHGDRVSDQVNSLFRGTVSVQLVLDLTELLADSDIGLEPRSDPRPH
jgi:hypothetical protein